VVQPLFGLWSDRRGAIWLLPAGVAVGGIGIALASASPAYGLVVLCVVVSGLGTAAYHPEGSKFAAYASGTRRASGMSLFSVGGNVGYALGVLVTTPIVVGLGLTGGVLMASNVVVPPAILVFVLVGGIPGAIALCVVGPAVVGTFGVTMVMSQEYLPRHIGMASGLSIGLSIGLGGVAAVILGAVADSI